jgi:hypothetical protein
MSKKFKNFSTQNSILREKLCIYIYIKSMECRRPSDGNIQAPEACPLTKILLDNMLVEDDKRES